MERPERLNGATKAGLALFSRPGGLSDEDLIGRLGIYHYAVHIRFVEALDEDFPLTAGILRRLKRRTRLSFEEWVGLYQRKHPSRYRSLSQYGVEFAAFLSRQRRRLGSDAAWLSELARFEWEQVLSSFGAPVAPLDFTALAALPPEQWDRARVKLDPSVRFFESRWALAPLLGERPRLKCAPGEFRAAIFRRASGAIGHLELDSRLFGAFKRLQRGARLQAACAGLPPEAAPQVMEGFALWAREGLIREISASG